MMARIVWYCTALLFILTPASGFQKLKSIDDLKRINFGKSVPKHSLILLHWFANTVDIDNNDVIRLTFDPDSQDYGSHHYGNFEGMLDPIPRGNVRYRYFTVGNLHAQTSSELPRYVRSSPSGYEGDNRDRIVFRVREQGQQIIDRVYITQHYETYEQQGTRYNPDHTYQITTHLLRQIREFSVEEDERNSLSDLRDDFGSNANDYQLNSIRNIWGNLACLGLLLFIVIQERNYSSNQYNNRPQPRRNTQPDFVVDMTDNRDDIGAGNNMGITLNVTTGTGGKAKICWRNVPRHHLQEGVMVVLYKNNEDMTKQAIYYQSGSHETSVPLNSGLQVRLHKVRTIFCIWPTKGDEICRGPIFKNHTEKVKITNYDANLQLFVKDGKACARLYVKPSFRNEFKNSWVGFYTSANKATTEYEWWQWQWVTKFDQNTEVHDNVYDVYDYHSSLSMAPGVQARFIIKDYAEKACTPSWS